MKRADAASDANDRAFRSLRHRDFRLIWLAEGVSVTGTQVTRVAVAWQIYKLTGSPVALGILGLCRFVPIIVFGVAGGVLADRYDRRKMLLGATAMLMGVSAAFAFLTATGMISVVAIYALTILGAVVDSIANPTRQALVPLLVPKIELPGATTMTIIASQTASVGGPALGGVIIAGAGLSVAYTIDAISYGAIIVAVLVMHARPTLPPVTMSGFAAAAEGLRYLRQTPVLLGVMVSDFMATIFGVSTVLMPIFASEILGAGPRGLGLLLSAPAVGAVIVAGVLGASRIPQRAGRWVLLSIAVYGACLTGFGLSRHLWLSLVLLAVSGAADSFSMTLRHAIRTVLSPDAMRGRIAAVHRTLGAGGPQLGDFEAGLAASLVGAGPAVTIGGLLTVATAGVVARMVPSIPRYRFGQEPLATSEGAAVADAMLPVTPLVVPGQTGDD